MPRRPRIKLAGMPQHIVQRGINREACFYADEDYHCYLHWLKKSAADWGCAIHAYVLMTNHVHLLLTPETPDGPARLMQSLGRRYVQYINRSYRRSGSLWEDRYKSSVVQADNCLLRCMRYVELNPVRAAMVSDPAHYRWSSYRANGLGTLDEHVQPHPLYLSLAADEERRRSVYRALFRSELDDEAVAEIRLALAQSQPLGESRFAEAICKAARVRHCPARRGRPPAQHDTASPLTQGGFEF